MTARFLSIATAAALLGTTSPVFGAETFTVPISVVPGTVTLEQLGQIPAQPVTLPISQYGQHSYSLCAGVNGTFSAAETNGGIEVGLDAQVEALTADYGCAIAWELRFIAEMAVSELGGTATHVRPELSIVSESFSSLDAANLRFSVEESLGQTSSSPLPIAIGFDDQTLEWTSAGLSRGESLLQQLPLIPGDTVRFPLKVQLWFWDYLDDPNTTVGEVRVLIRFRTTVPEPSASIGLSIGGLACLGLGTVRGGSS